MAFTSFPKVFGSALSFWSWQYTVTEYFSNLEPTEEFQLQKTKGLQFPCVHLDFPQTVELKIMECTQVPSFRNNPRNWSEIFLGERGMRKTK